MNSNARLRGATRLLAGGGATAVVAVLVQALVVSSTNVSDKAWSYPWSPDAIVPVSVAYAGIHLLVLGGVLDLLRSGVTGRGRLPMTGGWLLLAGTALLTVGELASIPIRHNRLESSAAHAVGAVFGVAILLTLIGLFVLGVTTVGRWDGWGRWSPLAAAVCTTPLLVLNSTHYLATGVALYGASLAVIGLALRTDPGSTGTTSQATRETSREAWEVPAFSEQHVRAGSAKTP
ncbi:MAG: hypothetical protein JWP11_778 [Frankiales bacterium]|jgi:hypothetical protein|nr:hypothetical protein [Frankiales bacterium]